MKILFISTNYPSIANPQMGTFVYKLVQEFVHKGNCVEVISPLPINNVSKKEVGIYGEEKAKIFRPKYISFSNIKVFNFNTYSITKYFASRSIKNTFKKNNITADIVYCHFISSYLYYFQAFPNCNLKKYIAVGEYKNIEIIRSYYDRKLYNLALSKVDGFIAVSPQVKLKLLQIGVPESKIIVAPNATDLTTFKPRNKIELREKYGLPKNKKLVLFVGRFLENKGPLRVLEAANQLDNTVKVICIGKGPQKIEGDKVLFAGAVPHDQVAEYMSLSDIFILPTLHEGSSNVIIEAMASGLPIISSDIPEIKVQCDPSFSVLIDPMNIEQITAALDILTKDNDLREKMSNNALNQSKDFDLSSRAEKILNFINNQI